MAATCPSSPLPASPPRSRHDLLCLKWAAERNRTFPAAARLTRAFNGANSQRLLSPGAHYGGNVIATLLLCPLWAASSGVFPPMEEFSVARVRGAAPEQLRLLAPLEERDEAGRWRPAIAPDIGVPRLPMARRWDIATSLGLVALEYSFPARLARLRCPCDPAEVNALDRTVIGNHSEGGGRGQRRGCRNGDPGSHALRRHRRGAEHRAARRPCRHKRGNGGERGADLDCQVHGPAPTPQDLCRR